MFLLLMVGPLCIILIDFIDDVFDWGSALGDTQAIWNVRKIMVVELGGT